MTLGRHGLAAAGVQQLFAGGAELLTPRRFEVKRLADQDVLIADTRLTLSSSTLDTVITLGRRDRPLRRVKR